MHKIGYIGFGGMGGGYHFQVARDRKDAVENIEPYAVYDIRQSQRDIAVKEGLKAFDNLEDFLASEVDIVVVATPNNLHKEFSCAAMRAGKNVICEKPAAMNPAEFEEMMKCSKETGKMLCIHQNRRTDRDFIIAKQIFEQKLIGKPYMIYSRVGGEGAGGLWGWRGFQDQGGGFLRDWGVHLLDQILWLFDEPIKSVYGIVRNNKSDECDDYARTVVQFESGLVADVEVSTHNQIKLPRWNVYGDGGAFQIDDIYSNYAVIKSVPFKINGRGECETYTRNEVKMRSLRNLAGESTTYNFPPEDQRPTQDWTVLYRNIIDSIDGKAELIVKPEQVLRCLKVIDASFKSSELGETIRF